MTENTLTEFKTAIQNNDFASAIDQYDDVNRALQIQQERDRGVLQIARRAVANTKPSSPLNQQAQQFIELSGNVEQQRLSLNFQFFGLVAGDVSPEAVVEDIEDTITLRNKIQTSAETLRMNAGEEFSIPALSIYGIKEPEAPIIAEGESRELEITLENAGTTELNELTISVKTEDEGIDTSVSPTVIDSLDPGEARTVLVEIETSEEGETNNVLKINGGNISTSEQLPLNVFDKSDFLEVALATIQETRDFLESEIEKAVKGINKRLEKVQEDVRDAKSQADEAEDDSRATQIDSLIRTAINLIRGMINQATNGNVAGLSDTQEGRLVQNLREIKDDLEKAKETPI